MRGLNDNELWANSSSFAKTTIGIASVLLPVLAVAVGTFFAARIHATLFTYTYPPNKDILVDRIFQPDDLSAVSSGQAITVTIDVTNNEEIPLRGFYYSDQVPNGWLVNTASVSVNGSPIADYTYGQGYANEVYTGLTPHRWALEMPEGSGVFSPTHLIPASGGTAQFIYTMIVSGGSGSDYSVGHEGWAGWQATVDTAVFGYQDTANTPTATPTSTPTPTQTITHSAYLPLVVKQPIPTLTPTARH